MGGGLRVAGAAHRGGVDFLRAQIEARPGQLTIVAVGELTNVAALLTSSPGIAGKIERIALMGGAVRRGGQPGSAPQPEWNIKSNAAAAQTVFASGVPLIVGPLDATADLKLTPEHRVRIFGRGTPFTDALGALDYVWTQQHVEGCDAHPLRPVAYCRALRSGHRDVRGAPRRRGEGRPHARSRLDARANADVAVGV